MTDSIDTEEEDRPVKPAMLRGWRGRCPNCGSGPLLKGYLAVRDICPVCGQELFHHRADDGPAYFTILLVGHLVVAPMLFFPFIWRSPPALVVPGVLIPLAGLTLLILPRVKGAVIGLLYALKVRRQDGALHTADRLE